jgi:hypothetical protein
MIISRKYAKALIRAGRARCVGSCTLDDGGDYAIIIRFDRRRVDHYKITRLKELWHPICPSTIDDDLVSY